MAMPRLFKITSHSAEVDTAGLIGKAMTILSI